MVVVDPPGFDNSAGVGQVEEPVFVEAFILEFAVEGLDKGVPDRLVGIDEVQAHALAIGSFVGRLADHLGTIVQDDLLGQPAGLRKPLEDAHDPGAGQ